MKYFLMLLLWAATTVAFAQTSYKVNSNGGLNLRETPGTNSKTILSIPDGTKVTVVDKSNDKWWKVKVDGKTGYMASDFLKEDKNSSSNNSNVQNKNSYSSNNSSSSKTRSGSSSSSSNSVWAAGLRLGDPFGLTVKKYLHNNRAFEFNVGRTTYWGYDYKDRFYHHEKYKDVDYNGYNRRGAISMQFHYLYHKDISSTEGLQWYLGFGPQLRLKSYSYQYKYRAYYPNGSEYWVHAEEKFTDVDLGVDGVIGLEYKINNSPLSIFGEANFFFEIVDVPSIIGQGGLGIRFHF